MQEAYVTKSTNQHEPPIIQLEFWLFKEKKNGSYKNHPRPMPQQGRRWCLSGLPSGSGAV